MSEQVGQPVPLTVEQVAGIFDVTEKTIRSWIRSGLQTIKEGGKGKGNGALLDLVQVVEWYLQENALDVAKTRLASAQADKHEMDNAVRRGELAELKTIEHEWSDLVMAFRAKMLSLPTKLSPRLINVADISIVASKLREEIQSALTELAHVDGDQGGTRRRTTATRTSGKDGKATSTTHRKSVGRRKQKAKQRK